MFSTVFAYLPKVLYTLVLGVIAWFVARIRRSLVTRVLSRVGVDQQDNPALDQITLPEQIILRIMDSVSGGRGYEGEVTVDGHSVPLVFTPYADCGNNGSRFRVAFPK